MPIHTSLTKQTYTAFVPHGNFKPQAENCQAFMSISKTELAALVDTCEALNTEEIIGKASVRAFSFQPSPELCVLKD
jgi:hypothetical protein